MEEINIGRKKTIEILENQWSRILGYSLPNKTMANQLISVYKSQGLFFLAASAGLFIFRLSFFRVVAYCLGWGHSGLSNSLASHIFLVPCWFWIYSEWWAQASIFSQSSKLACLIWHLVRVQGRLYSSFLKRLSLSPSEIPKSLLLSSFGRDLHLLALDLQWLVIVWVTDFLVLSMVCLTM